MSPAALKRAALLLAVLVIVLVSVRLVGGSAVDDPAGGVALPRLTMADVERILVERPADTLDFRKGGGTGWTVSHYAASVSSVQEWFAALGQAAESSELVARSASSYERMGVDGAGGRRVRFLSAAGDALIDMFVGNRGRVAMTGYVRLTGESGVYQVTGQLATLADRRLEDWRDRRIARVPIDSVVRIDVERRRERYTLRRQADSTWTIDGQAADSATVARLIGAVADLQASGFPTAAQLDSITFAAPFRRVRFSAADGRELLMLEMDSTAAGTWARRDPAGTVYRLDRWRIDGIAPADSLVGRGTPD